MIEFIISNWWKFLLVIIGLILLIVGIVYRKQLAKKIKQETISFTALIISISLAIIGIITQPKTEVTTLAYIGGQRISLFIPITGILVILTIVFLIIFFRKELTKDVKIKW